MFILVPFVHIGISPLTLVSIPLPLGDLSRVHTSKPSVTVWDLGIGQTEPSYSYGLRCTSYEVVKEQTAPTNGLSK